MPVRVHAHRGQHRATDARLELTGDLVLGAVEVDEGGGAAAHLAHLGDEVAVDVVAHAHAEDARLLAQVLLEGAEHLLVVADEAVRHEQHHAEAGRVVGGHHGLLGRHAHVGATAAPEVGHVGQGALHVLRRGRHGGGGELRHLRVEVEHLEGVLGVQVAQHLGGDGLGLLDGLAGLRARGVQHQVQLARHHLLLLGLELRVEQHEEVALLGAGLAVHQHGRADERVGHEVLQGEGLVGDAVVRGQLHAGAARALARHRHLVRGGAQLVHGHARVQAQGEADVTAAADVGRQHRRGDAARVGDGGGVRRGALALAEGPGLAADVARAHRHGEVEAVPAALVDEPLHVVDAHADFFTREDVGHGLGEEVGALLVEQRGRLPLGAGALVGVTRLLARLDDAADDALADDELHGVHRGLLREREDVEGLERLGVGVGEDLGDGDAGEEAAHLGVHLGVLQAELLGLGVGAAASGGVAAELRHQRALGDGPGAEGRDGSGAGCLGEGRLLRGGGDGQKTDDERGECGSHGIPRTGRVRAVSMQPAGQGPSAW